jgi:hypothetical protein
MIEFLNIYILVDLEILGIEVDEGEWDNYLSELSFKGVFLRLIPFNVMYMYSYMFIIPLNIFCLLLYYSKKNLEELKSQALSRYFLNVISVYIGSFVVFFILRFIFFEDRGFANTGGGVLKLMCESYSPYSPFLITGFLLANILFGWILIYILTPVYYCLTKNTL